MRPYPAKFATTQSVTFGSAIQPAPQTPTLAPPLSSGCKLPIRAVLYRPWMGRGTHAPIRLPVSAQTSQGTQPPLVPEDGKTEHERVSDLQAAWDARSVRPVHPPSYYEQDDPDQYFRHQPLVLDEDYGFGYEDFLGEDHCPPHRRVKGRRIGMRFLHHCPGGYVVPGEYRG